MRAADVVGRKIVKVFQYPLIEAYLNTRVWCVEYFVLDNGVRVDFDASDLVESGEGIVTATCSRPPKVNR